VRWPSVLRKYRSLLSLLGERNLQVSLLAYRIALHSQSKDAGRREARARLDELRPRVPWLERLQIDESLDSAND